jgi:PHD/YefM family antitoxin component YafN of YafNO toxin-antitoxin module
MLSIPSTTTITELRRESAKILKNLPKEKLMLLIQNSKPKGALIDLDYLKMLQEAYEDYMDTIAYDEAVADINKEPLIPWEEFKKESEKVK